MKFGKLGLGFGSGNFNNRPPYNTLLDQMLMGFPVTSSGVITDMKGSHPAQLVEQPCGVFDGVATTKLSLDSLITITDGDYIEFYINFDGFATGDGVCGRTFSSSYVKLKSSSETTYLNGETTLNGDSFLIEHSLIPFVVGTTYLFRFGFHGLRPYVSIDGTIFNATGDVNTNSLAINAIGQAYYDYSIDGKIWDVKIYKDGAFVLSIPDPSTGYDISGNENHGTPTDVTAGTQDVSASIQQYGFDRYTLKTTPFTVHDVPKTIAGSAIDVSAKHPSETYDHVSHPPIGILPLGGIEFNSDNTAPTPAELRVYDRSNIFGQTYEYWKEEIQLLESYNPSHPERHDLDELTNGDYIRVLGTQLLIQRLFLKGCKTDGDWSAISNILNYSEVLDATERQKVFNYLKDPSKENQEAWELYQASTVVAAYRFDQPLSLFNEDGELCKLGWESEDVLKPLDFVSDTWSAGGTGTIIDNDSFSVTDGTGLIVNNAFWITGDHGKTFAMYLTFTGTEDLQIRSSGSGVTFNGLSEVILSPGSHRIICVVTANDNIVLDNAGSGATTFAFTTKYVTEIGNTVSKVLDVGSGGVDGKTYYNLTQSDLSKQGKRIAGGIELNANAEYAIDISMNGKECYIEKMDGTFTTHFTVASSKITAAEIYAQITSYEVKSLKII